MIVADSTTAPIRKKSLDIRSLREQCDEIQSYIFTACIGETERKITAPSRVLFTAAEKALKTLRKTARDAGSDVETCCYCLESLLGLAIHANTVKHDLCGFETVCVRLLNEIRHSLGLKERSRRESESLCMGY